jgi:putative hydrolase of the HAD superfamily
MKIKAVLFDIDGTLYANSQVYRRSFGLFAKYGWIWLKFAKVRHALHLYPERVDQSGMSFVDYQANEVALAFGGKYTMPHIRQVLQQFITDMEQMFDDIPAISHVKELLDLCKAQGLPLGVLSDFPLGHKVDQLGLGGYWQVAVSTQDCGTLKPDRRSFLYCANQFGLEPQDILYVGNSYKYDVIGAKGAGMQAAHYSKKAYTQPVQADITFHDYRQLWHYIATQNQYTT